MKKLLCMTVAVFCIIGILTVPCFAKDKKITAIIPDYNIIIDDASIYYKDSLYPFLNYKGITYLPMTYGYARALNLTTSYLKDSAFMVAYNPSEGRLPIYETTENTKEVAVLIPTGYNIYVNGKKRDNTEAEYPLLSFRDVTYFPLTWDMAVNEFGWDLSFNGKTFTVNTGKVGVNYAIHMDLKEKRERDAVIEKASAEEIPSGDGNFRVEYKTEYLSVDYKTGEIKNVWDYIPPEKQFYKNEEAEISVKDGYVYYKEAPLEGIYIKETAEGYTLPEDILNFEYRVSAISMGKCSLLDVIDVRIYTANTGYDSRWGRDEAYTYINTGNSVKYLGRFVTVENVYTLGDDIYFNTVEYQKTIMTHYKSNRKLWKLSEDGTLNQIQYADYGSMKIIGKAGDKLYLKCMWAPVDYLADSGLCDVSLINDGYYTFDGEGIRFVSPYVYSDFDVLSDDGDIIAVNKRLGKITRLEINPEYY